MKNSVIVCKEHRKIYIIIESGDNMFKEIEIGCYRGLRDIRLSELAQINVIIGENNSGKTSILEALQLFNSRNVLENAISVARKRESQLGIFVNGRLLPFDMLFYSFPMGNGDFKEIDVRVLSGELGHCRVGIRAGFHKQLFIPENDTMNEQRHYENYCDEDGYIRVMSGEYLYDCKNREIKNFYFNETQRKPQIQGEGDFIYGRKSSLAGSDMPKILFISPMDIYTNRIISASLYKGMLVEEKRRLLELLQLFDERIVGIETGVQYGRPVTFVEMEECGLVPISVFGDGLKKVLTLASAIVKTRGGIVLIDEFETGIHKYALIQVAKWLAMVTERYEVQVFLTTHSDDAIDALVKAQEDNRNINAYRLEHYKSRIFVKKFEGLELYRLRREQGMDIL